MNRRFFTMNKLNAAQSLVRSLLLTSLCLSAFFPAFSQTSGEILSPNGKIKLMVDVSERIYWKVILNSLPVLEKSAIGMTLENGEVLGENPKVLSIKKDAVNSQIPGLFYKKKVVDDSYSQMDVFCKGNYKIEFRAYNDGVAYRFVTDRKQELTIASEQTEFNFGGDYHAYIPYVNDAHNKDVFQCSFENNYQYIQLSKIEKDTLCFAPVLVALPGNIKVGISEADLESYPGMFLQIKKSGFGFNGVFAPYPLEEVQGGHNNLQSFVKKRADYIAKVKGKRSFPWRTLFISETDKDLLDNDMVYKLAAPARIKDASWVRPGKVAWDWWNDLNISGVDFKAGINTATYKYYVDFASANNIEYILLDEGWATSEDIMTVVKDINLKEIVQYAESKGVGVWLWGGWLPLDKQLDLALSTYASLGIKGFKIDFMDRDDQKMVDFYYRFAEKAAAYKLMVDFHGAYKPTGLHRTYPNVLTFEGVRGLENVKWSDTDFPAYDCSIPFIRMLAGPMDYTPGAMRNASRSNFRAIFSMPMSQGTRCHQLALYVLFESPFSMLADSPTNYLKEPESTSFISAIPTVFDATVALDGQVGEFAAIARKKGSTWYVGAITNWNARELSLDFSFLDSGKYEAVIFSDGINADRDANDYKRLEKTISASDKITVQLSAGGGWAAILNPIKDNK